MPKTLEEQIKEQEDTLQQVRLETDVQQARLSKIQNEISARLLEADKASEDKYAVRLAQLEGQYEKVKADQDKNQAYLDDYLVRLEAKSTDIASREIAVDKKEELLKEKTDKFEVDVAKFNQNLADAEKSCDKHVSDIEARAKLQIEKDKAQDLREKNLDEREASFEKTLKNIDDKIADTQVVVNENEAILANIDAKKASIEAESLAIRENLNAIQREKDNLIQLSAIKDDIAKFEEEKAKFVVEKAGIIQLSKNVELRDKAVTEREQTASEKEKYQAIRDREITAKISVLEKLRKENA